MSQKIKVLIIEDDRTISSFIVTSLSGNGYSVIPAFSGNEGISLAGSACPDVILLDLGLPDMDGCEVLRTLREWKNVPILVISARSKEEDKVQALDFGADDYLTKPFGTAELMARIRTCMRRRQSILPNRTYKAADLEINWDTRRVTLSGQEIHLTQIEYQLITLLAENSGKVLTYNYIMNSIWGPFLDSSNQILRVNMANIRRKIEKNPAQPQYIFTEVGVGYRMRECETGRNSD